MPKAVLVKRGKEYLHDVPLPKLEEMHRREPPGKSRDRLQAAVLRKRGKTVEKIAGIVGRHSSTVHRWLYRMECEGPDGRHDRKSPGRPRLLTPEQEGAVEEDLDKPPPESGFDRGSWNSRLLARRICGRLGVACSRRTALRVAGRLGFSTCKPWPIPYNSATPEEQEEFIRDKRGAIARWREEGRAVLAVDATTLRDSPTSRRGLRRRGGKSVVRTNHSKKAIHLIGALGDGTLDLQFHENLNGESYVALAEYARRRHGKVGIIADNAGALTGKDMREYVAGTNGAVEIIHIPPRTPQLNPIEIEWREIKAAIADIFFGGLDKMRDAIIRMLYNKEIPIVRLFDWLLPP